MASTDGAAVGLLQPGRQALLVVHVLARHLNKRVANLVLGLAHDTLVAAGTRHQRHCACRGKGGAASVIRVASTPTLSFKHLPDVETAAFFPLPLAPLAPATPAPAPAPAPAPPAPLLGASHACRLPRQTRWGEPKQQQQHRMGFVCCSTYISPCSFLTMMTGMVSPAPCVLLSFIVYGHTS